MTSASESTMTMDSPHTNVRNAQMRITTGTPENQQDIVKILGAGTMGLLRIEVTGGDGKLLELALPFALGQFMEMQPIAAKIAWSPLEEISEAAAKELKVIDFVRRCDILLDGEDTPEEVRTIVDAMKISMTSGNFQPEIMLRLARRLDGHPLFQGQPRSAESMIQGIVDAMEENNVTQLRTGLYL